MIVSEMQGGGGAPCLIRFSFSFNTLPLHIQHLLVPGTEPFLVLNASSLYTESILRFNRIIIPINLFCKRGSGRKDVVASDG